MIGLQRPYPTVDYGTGVSYGGSQMHSEKAAIRKCACGPVAALDLLRYLDTGSLDEPVSLLEYNRELERLCRHYFPLLPPFGINGFMLILGLNRLFIERKLPYRAFWAASGHRLWNRVENQLSQDLPVILSVGPNFPAVWQKHLLDFYVKSRDGRYIKSTCTKSHYVTATGIDAEWVRISSWGRCYYINRKEYEAYVRKHSNYLFSNMVLLKRL
jgi:hypothetical protein